MRLTFSEIRSRAIPSIRIVALLLAIHSIAAGNWTSKNHFLMFYTQHAAIGANRIPSFTANPSTADEDAKPVLLAPLIIKVKNAIEVAKEQYKHQRDSVPKQDPRSTSAKKAQETRETNTAFADLEKSIQAHLDTINAKTVRIRCMIVDVVPYKPSQMSVKLPETITNVLLGRARLITGLSPEAQQKLAKARNQKYANEEMKRAALQRITDEDQFSESVGIYFFGNDDLANLKVGNSFEVEGKLQKVGLFYDIKYKLDAEPAFEVAIIADAKTPTTMPTTQESPSE